MSRLFDTGAVAHVGGMLWPEPEVFQRTEDTIVVPREALVPDCAKAPGEPPSLGRAQTERRFARMWSVEGDGRVLEGDSATHARALAVLAGIARAPGYTRPGEGEAASERVFGLPGVWALVREHPGYTPVPGGALDTWAALAWRYARQAGEDVYQSGLGLGGAPSLSYVAERMREAAEGVGRTPAYPLARWKGGPGPIGAGRRSAYFWGERSVSAEASAARRTLQTVLNAASSAPLPRTSFPHYARSASRLLISGYTALRIVGHIAWQLDRLLSVRHESTDRVVGVIRRLTTNLRPLASAPVERLHGVLHLEAQRCAVSPEWLAHAEVFLEARWRAFASAAVMHAWGVPPDGLDHPRRCGVYCPPGAERVPPPRRR